MSSTSRWARWCTQVGGAARPPTSAGAGLGEAWSTVLGACCAGSSPTRTHPPTSGVDYEAILRQAEQEADVIIWDGGCAGRLAWRRLAPVAQWLMQPAAEHPTRPARPICAALPPDRVPAATNPPVPPTHPPAAGGNNDTPFYRPDLFVCVTDPHRLGHEQRFYPGDICFRCQAGAQTSSACIRPHCKPPPHPTSPAWPPPAPQDGRRARHKQGKHRAGGGRGQAARGGGAHQPARPGARRMAWCLWQSVRLCRSAAPCAAGSLRPGSGCRCGMQRRAPDLPAHSRTSALHRAGRCTSPTRPSRWTPHSWCAASAWC